jgi:uncharacterized protein YggU (UPF0235/DUF167 family)
LVAMSGVRKPGQKAFFPDAKRKASYSFRITFWVKPRAPMTRLIGRHGDGWKVELKAPPEGGRANEELLAFLAKLLGVRKENLCLLSGASSRRKVVSVESPLPMDLERVLARAAERAAIDRKG